jgi:very-short-patch-repair endonuclease
MQDEPRLLRNAKRMRHVPTDAEALIWRKLRAGRLSALKFKRQQPLGRFIVDFVCFSRKLIVEVDGGQHADALIADQARTAWLESQGFRVIRFWNHDVLKRTESVLEEILRALQQ